MKQARHELLVQDTHADDEIERPRTLRRLLKLSAVASGAALALARLGGVAFAAGPDLGGSDGQGLNATAGHFGDLALMAGTTAPAIGQEATAIGLGGPGLYSVLRKP